MKNVCNAGLLSQRFCLFIRTFRPKRSQIGVPPFSGVFTNRLPRVILNIGKQSRLRLRNIFSKGASFCLMKKRLRNEGESTLWKTKPFVTACRYPSPISRKLFTNRLILPLSSRLLTKSRCPRTVLPVAADATITSWTSFRGY